MEAIDTNILVRIATRDDMTQLARVEKLMAEKFSDENPAWVSVIVLTELSWVLGRTYGYSRTETGAFIRKLLDTASILVEDEILVSHALDLFMDSTADFSDCLILARNESRSISPTHTLDRKAAKLEGFRLL
ncbi:type II toxin-antitoxin system VapC family toxin [bacterium]|nr:type II toxin-antitoxin system VapC family toxin [bacterium]